MLNGELLPRGRQVDFTELAPERWKPGFATPFNQRMIGGKVLITNEFGDWLLLEPAEFRSFIEGRPQPGEPVSCPDEFLVQRKHGIFSGCRPL